MDYQVARPDRSALSAEDFLAVFAAAQSFVASDGDGEKPQSCALRGFLTYRSPDGGSSESLYALLSQDEKITTDLAAKFQRGVMESGAFYFSAGDPSSALYERPDDAAVTVWPQGIEDERARPSYPHIGVRIDEQHAEAFAAAMRKAGLEPF